MAICIFDFWSEANVGLTTRIHPEDEGVLNRLECNERNKEKKHGFDLSCLPACFTGKLKTAPVVLLYLAPGLNAARDHEEARSEAGQISYLQQRKGDAPLRGPEFAGHTWWVSRTQCFKIDREKLRDKVAILNICAYHSKEFKGRDRPLLAALPSSRVSIEWAQSVLFRQAIEGERVVICLRSATYWGLTVSDKPFGRALFAPPATPGGYMVNGAIRDEIIGVVQERLKAVV